MLVSVERKKKKHKSCALRRGGGLFWRINDGRISRKVFCWPFYFLAIRLLPLSLVSKRNKRHTKREKWSTTKISLLLNFFLREDYVGVSHWWICPKSHYISFCFVSFAVDPLIYTVDSFNYLLGIDQSTIEAKSLAPHVCHDSSNRLDVYLITSTIWICPLLFRRVSS